MDSEELDLCDKILYGMIEALSKKTGYCFASNEYIARYLSIDIDAVDHELGWAEWAGLIRVEFVKDKITKVIKRRLRVVKFVP